MIDQERRLKVVDRAMLETAHRDTMKVLSGVGVVFDSDDIIALMQKRGIKTDGRKVFFSESDVAAALGTCPRGFKMAGRDEEACVQIGPGQERMAVSPGNGTLYIQDMDGSRRRGTLADFHIITRLCEQSPHVHLVGGVPVDPGDLPDPSRPARLVHALMQYSRKPLIGVAATRQEAGEVFGIIEIAFGRNGFLDDNVAIAYSVNPASPLCFEPLSCETMMAYAEQGQALFILPGLMAGVSASLDPLGLLVLSNAEILAALTCIQTIRPGTPVVYSPGTFMVNMKNANTLGASPQGALVNLAGIQMGSQYYSLPTRTMAGLTDAKQVDFQAGAETMQNLMLYTLSGVNIINECLGVMDSILVTSFEKWVLDEELLERVHNIERGFQPAGLKTPFEAIASVGCGGSYLMHPDTLANCRKVWTPSVSDWNTYAEWQKKGAVDILASAHKRFEEKMAASGEMVLPAEADRDITRYLKIA